MVEHVLHVAELIYEFRCCFLTHARTSREVVGRVAHESQKVDDLEWGADGIFLANLRRSHFLVAASVARTEDEHVVVYELAVVFVGREHVGLHTLGARFGGECAYDVVGLEAVGLHGRYVHGGYDVLYYRNRSPYVFRCLLALGLVLRESLVAECLAVVEGHGHVGGLFLGEYLVERIYEAHDGRRIESFGVDARVSDKRVIGAVYQRVGID